MATASPLRRLLRLLVPLLLVASNLRPTHPLPLTTSGRFILDAATGQRVKLRCVNWAAHLPAVLPEGLDRRPVRDIAALVASLGFNCVRLTWATRAFTDPRYAGLTATASLARLGLGGAAEGVVRNNAWAAGATVQEAMDEAVAAAGDAGLMVVLDNHVSEPMWCCGGSDGNGFFGDRYFDGEEWLRGLRAVATRYRPFPQVPP